jgi:hypothetical protein
MVRIAQRRAVGVNVVLLDLLLRTLNPESQIFSIHYFKV